MSDHQEPAERGFGRGRGASADELETGIRDAGEAPAGSSVPPAKDDWAPLEEPRSDPLAAVEPEVAEPTVPEPGADTIVAPDPFSMESPDTSSGLRRKAPRPNRASRVESPAGAGGVPPRLAARPAGISRRRPAHRRGRPAAVLIPLAVVALGLGVGALMFLRIGNPPLGGLAAVLGVLGALFTRVLLRESHH